MSFFDAPFVDPTRLPRDIDPRIRSWGEGEVQTAATPGYEKQAKQAQAAAPNKIGGSSIHNSRIVRPVNVASRPSLPGNVRGLHNTSSGSGSGGNWETDYTPDRDSLPSIVHGPSLGTKPPAWSKGPPTSSKRALWSTKDLTNMVPEVRGSSATDAAHQGTSSSAHTVGLSSAAKARLPPDSHGKETNAPSRHAQSFASRASEKAPAAAQRQPTSSTPSSSLPPHLRPPPQVSSSSTAQSSKKDSKVSSEMNAGKAAKSAKFDSPFPCTYANCTRGFVKEKDMIRHKVENHDYCRVCKIDFEDDGALLRHKINSEDHICCVVCGEDFRSASGRDRHQRQVRSDSPYAFIRC
jgi:hypothetical protein